MMKLWLLMRLDEIGYDETSAVVVRAKNKSEARRMASTAARDEGPSVWMDSDLTSCEEISMEGGPGVILSQSKDG